MAAMLKRIALLLLLLSQCGYRDLLVVQGG
jgi:hypothetical protein